MEDLDDDPENLAWKSARWEQLRCEESVSFDEDSVRQGSSDIAGRGANAVCSGPYFSVELTLVLDYSWGKIDARNSGSF